MKQKYPLEKFFIYFSPYTAYTLEIDGVIYPTTEHAYQCMRYDNPQIIKEILEARSPVKAWEVSSKYKHLQIPNFRSKKLEVMRELIRLKVKQHDDVRQALLDSKEFEIVKHITTYPPGDGFWDDGENGEGENQMGKLWMELRKKLR